MRPPTKIQPWRGEPGRGAPRGVLVKKGDPSGVLESINETIASLNDSGKMDQLVETAKELSASLWSKPTDMGHRARGKCITDCIFVLAVRIQIYRKKIQIFDISTVIAMIINGIILKKSVLKSKTSEKL